jgi:hypothetical protein
MANAMLVPRGQATRSSRLRFQSGEPVPTKSIVGKFDGRLWHCDSSLTALHRIGRLHARSHVPDVDVVRSTFAPVPEATMR